MATEGKRKKGFIVSLVVLVLVILGVLWITIIFPAVDKVPTDYDRAYYFEGTFSVMNPATQSMDSFPVEQTLAQEAVGTEDGALLIHEVRTVVNSATGTDISAIYGDESTLAINRSTLEFVQEIDERGRWGQWGPPRPIGKDDSYDLWHPGAGQPLTANYVRSEDFRDLGVLVFEIDEEDIDLDEDAPDEMKEPEVDEDLPEMDEVDVTEKPEELDEDDIDLDTDMGIDDLEVD